MYKNNIDAKKSLKKLQTYFSSHLESNFEQNTFLETVADICSRAARPPHYLLHEGTLIKNDFDREKLEVFLKSKNYHLDSLEFSLSQFIDNRVQMINSSDLTNLKGNFIVERVKCSKLCSFLDIPKIYLTC